MGDEGREEDALLDAISAVLPPVMTGLEALGHVGRHLHPPNLPQLAGAVASMAAPVADGLARFREVDFPEHLQDFSRHVIEAAELEIESASPVVNQGLFRTGRCDAVVVGERQVVLLFRLVDRSANKVGRGIHRRFGYHFIRQR